jgi:hypothetical protein
MWANIALNTADILFSVMRMMRSCSFHVAVDDSRRKRMHIASTSRQ